MIRLYRHERLTRRSRGFYILRVIRPPSQSTKTCVFHCDSCRFAEFSLVSNATRRLLQCVTRYSIKLVERSDAVPRINIPIFSFVPVPIPFSIPDLEPATPCIKNSKWPLQKLQNTDIYLLFIFTSDVRAPCVQTNFLAVQIVGGFFSSVTSKIAVPSASPQNVEIGELFELV